MARAHSRIVQIKYIILDDYIEGIMPDGNTFYIDKDDFDFVQSNDWHYVNKIEFYLRSTKLGLMHRLLINAKEDEFVDHINRNKLDNRKSNLRIVTKQENMHNKSNYKSNKSGYNGIKWNKNLNKWQVQITRNKKRQHLGVFDNIQDAIIARRTAEIDLTY